MQIEEIEEEECKKDDSPAPSELSLHDKFKAVIAEFKAGMHILLPLVYFAQGSLCTCEMRTA